MQSNPFWGYFKTPFGVTLGGQGVTKITPVTKLAIQKIFLGF